jgi:hypothetical protein
LVLKEPDPPNVSGQLVGISRDELEHLADRCQTVQLGAVVAPDEGAAMEKAAAEFEVQAKQADGDTAMSRRKASTISSETGRIAWRRRRKKCGV